MRTAFWVPQHLYRGRRSLAILASACTLISCSATTLTAVDYPVLSDPPLHMVDIDAAGLLSSDRAAVLAYHWKQSGLLRLIPGIYGMYILRADGKAAGWNGVWLRPGVRHTLKVEYTTNGGNTRPVDLSFVPRSGGRYLAAAGCIDEQCNVLSPSNRFYFWIRDIDTGEVVAGALPRILKERFDAAQNPKAPRAKWDHTSPGYFLSFLRALYR